MRKSFCSLFLMAFMLQGLWLTPATAQERKGTIAGRVMDASHAVLQGARVELHPGGLTAVSDGQGQFTIPGVAPGRYAVTISYVGFTTFSSSAEVTAGTGANVDAVLQVGAQGGVVEGRAERQHGEIEAINRGRTADKLFQVLPSEVLTTFPNPNLTLALGPPPRLS